MKPPEEVVFWFKSFALNFYTQFPYKLVLPTEEESPQVAPQSYSNK